VLFLRLFVRGALGDLEFSRLLRSGRQDFLELYNCLGLL